MRNDLGHSFIYHFLFLEPFKTFLMLKTHHFGTCVGPTRIRLGVLLLGTKYCKCLEVSGKGQRKSESQGEIGRRHRPEEVNNCVGALKLGKLKST